VYIEWIRKNKYSVTLHTESTLCYLFYFFKHLQ